MMGDHLTSTDSPPAEMVTPASEPAVMPERDALDDLADDIKALTAKTCAKIAELYIIPLPENEFQNGYNAACRAIAAKISEVA